jgi:hypothetical protein
MAGELLLKGMHIMMRPFDAEYLLHQRMEATVLSPRASQCYTGLQDMESKVLLKTMLQSNDFKHNFERYSASIVYSLTYGFRIETGDEWQLQTAHEVLKNFTYAGQVGAWIVDAFPILKHLPTALAPFKQKAETWYQIEADLHMRNMQDALKAKSWNWSKDFMASKERDEGPLSDIEIAFDLGILCDAGVETTNVTMQVFILACCCYPEFIKTAQKELDEVVGGERLPTFEDLDRLPYIQAVIEENFRWRHIVPAGVPHATSQDDYYKGYYIPKGSTIVPMFIAMRNDKKQFDSPEHFRPERWLGKQQVTSNWGYGRRVCPGRFIARNSLSIGIARLLWAFNIAPKDGKAPLVEEEFFTAGFVSGPRQFDAVFTPRSEKHRMIIEHEFEAADKDVSNLLDDIRKKQFAVGLTPRA